MEINLLGSASYSLTKYIPSLLRVCSDKSSGFLVIGAISAIVSRIRVKFLIEILSLRRFCNVR